MIWFAYGILVSIISVIYVYRMERALNRERRKNLRIKKALARAGYRCEDLR